jgi:hypothetical protein
MLLPTTTVYWSREFKYKFHLIYIQWHIIPKEFHVSLLIRPNFSMLHIDVTCKVRQGFHARDAPG